MTDNLLLQAAMITPLTAGGQLDISALDALVHRVLRAGRVGFSILGSTGEGASIPADLRQALREAVLERVDGQVPVFSGVVGNVFRDLQEDLRQATTLPLSGVLIPPPSYYPMDPPDLLNFYQTLANFSTLPVMLYNIPVYTKISIPPEIVAQLAAHPNIMGIKDSSRDFDYFLSVISLTRHIPEFKVITGTETLVLPALAAGGAGAVLGSANIVPQWIAEIATAIEDQQWDEARDVEDRLVRLASVLRRTNGVRGFKYATALIDRHPGYLMPPYQPLNPQNPVAQAIAHFLQQWNLLEVF